MNFKSDLNVTVSVCNLTAPTHCITCSLHGNTAAFISPIPHRRTRHSAEGFVYDYRNYPTKGVKLK